VIRRRGPEAGAVEGEELDRLCDRLARIEAPFDEITRSRAEARLSAELERQPGRGHRRALGRVAALLAVGAAAGAALTARTVVTARRSRVAGGPEAAVRFEPYVVAPTAGAEAATMPEALEQPASRLDVPAGWLVRASMGDAIAITLTGPARAWSERAAGSGQTVVHLDRGRLLASLEGGTGRRLQIVSPGAITDVVGTLFSVEVVGGASRVTVAHGRVRVGTAPGPSGAPPRASREIAAGQSWLTTLPEPDEIEPALAEALFEHERTPPPRGATVPLSVIEAPAGSGVWVGRRRIASAPAWMLVESHLAVRLSAPARAAAPTANPLPPPTTEPTTEPLPEPAPEPFRPGTESRARATSPAGPRPLLARSGAESTEPPAFAPPEEMTAQTLFREADAARAAGDTGLALRTLRTVVERFPRESATAAARYELALMEETAGQRDAALRDLAAVDIPSLEEPTDYLRCRVLAKRSGTEAERCLADFRRRFPASAHDADALGAETALVMVRGGCPAAEALLAELERRYPKHGSAVRLRAACGGRP
jgi:FecR-like protein